MATSEEFIEKWPLYTVFEAEPFFQPPESISLGCRVCRKETTWNRTQTAQLEASSPYAGYTVTYKCGLCRSEHLVIIIRTVQTMSNAILPAKVQKIGQFPAQSIEIPRDLEKRLGDAAQLYKNALICRAFNFGIAALAYIRRVIEDKSNELIEVIAQQAESYAVGETIVKTIRAAEDERLAFDQRLRLASEAIPSALKPDGANPLAALYGLLSDGLHARSEDECILIVDETRDVFEYVFARLRAEIEDRQAFTSKVKKWAGGRAPKTTDPPPKK